MQKFLKFFKDGHLFVLEIPTFNSDELSAFKNVLRGKMHNVDSVCNYLIKNKNSLDKVEGVWTDGNSRFAIVKNHNTLWGFQYVAVIISHAQSAKIGEVKFGVNLKDHLYEGTSFKGYAPRYVAVEPCKENSILSILGGQMWGRVNYTDKSSIGEF